MTPEAIKERAELRSQTFLEQYVTTFGEGSVPKDELELEVAQKKKGNIDILDRYSLYRFDIRLMCDEDGFTKKICHPRKNLKRV
jgi:hypothetical protein